MPIAHVGTIEEPTLVEDFKNLSDLEYLQQVFQLVNKTVPAVSAEMSRIFEEERSKSRTLSELLSRPKVKEIYRPQDRYQYGGVTATKLWMNDRVLLIILSTEDATFVHHNGLLFYSWDLNSHCPSSFLVEKRLHDFENTDDIRARARHREMQHPCLAKKEGLVEAPWKTKTFYPVVDAVVLNF